MKSRDFRVLVVDDDLEYAKTCATVIRRAGYDAQAVNSAADTITEVQSDPRVRLVLSDLRMAGSSGIELLKELKALDPKIEVIIMTGYASIETAIEAIRARAAEYIIKPFDRDELLNAVAKTYEVWRLTGEVRRLKGLLGEELKIDGYVFSGQSMTEAYRRALAATEIDCSVLIAGESGTGKELFARAIHNGSGRANKPFVAINCSTLTGELMESELFGYRRGAFTGADRDHDGLFLAAHSGTLFLDEIAEMPQGMQAKLLRSLQERSIRPRGSVEEIQVDVRFIAATNVDIREALSERRLREDLYHRLNVIPINLPPLRENRDDIPGLLEYLIARANERHMHTVRSVESQALQMLVAYRWPGNIREMQNLIERIFSVDRTEVITSSNLPPHIRAACEDEENGTDKTPVLQLSDAERDLVVRALREANGNKSRAAEILGISRPRLYKKIELYNIQPT